MYKILYLPNFAVGFADFPLFELNSMDFENFWNNEKALGLSPNPSHGHEIYNMLQFYI